MYFSLLLDFQIGSKISTSIVRTTEEIMTAERDAVGIKAKWGVKKEHAAITRTPVTIPPNGVWTPLALKVKICRMMTQKKSVEVEGFFTITHKSNGGG